ncbi:hypothetical protein ABW19_dt0207335 [Dactylella cylindrospora]|nr:hypothetical protein ABW19_dt0207335 [Dactylella cylindrospora]
MIASSKMANLSMLPTEILTEILLYLPWQDHIYLFLVCRRFHALLQTEPLIGGRYFEKQSRPDRPQIHGIFSDVGLEFEVFDKALIRAEFIMNEREGGGTWTEQGWTKQVIDIYHHPILDDKMIRFIPREKEYQTKLEWRMGLLTLWALRGFGVRTRQMQWRDNITFVQNSSAEGGGSSSEECWNDLTTGVVDMNITVREFLEAVGRYVMKHYWVGYYSRGVSLRVGLYEQFDMIVIRNILEPIVL